MKKILSVVAAIPMFWVGFADAHGPTRQKYTSSIEISAAPDAVWAVVGDFANPNWLPMVESTASQGGNEKGATRELKLKGGGSIKEELKNVDAEKKSVQYKVVDPTDPKVLPVNNYSSTIEVTPGANGGSKVEWNAAFYRWFLNNNPPPEENEAAANAAVEKIVKDSLANLKVMLEKK